MRDNRFYIDGRLYQVNYEVDAPPWPVQVWNDDEEVWEPLGIYGAEGPAGPGGSLLILTPNPYNFISATAQDVGQPPDFVLTAAGDVISVPGM